MKSSRFAPIALGYYLDEGGWGVIEQNQNGQVIGAAWRRWWTLADADTEGQRMRRERDRTKPAWKVPK